MLRSFFCLVSAVVLLFSMSVVLAVPPPVPPFMATNAFADGDSSITSQAIPLVNGIAITAVVRAEFNCGKFQIMCYNTASSIADFNACTSIDDIGSIKSNVTTVPGSSPDAICNLFQKK